MTRSQVCSWLVVGVLGALVAALAGCAGSQREAGTDFADRPWEVRMESPLDTVVVTEGEDAATLAGEPREEPDFPEGSDTAVPVLDSPVVAETRSSDIPEAQVFTPGWRVQIFASSSMVSADELAEKARAAFTEPVYVEYEPPFYKVRVGDFLTKQEAHHMMNRAKAEDFDAWVVEALVVRPAR
jgi:hypothetical protein